MLLPTGIPKLDELMGGGIEKGASILFSCIPGVQGEPLVEHLLYTRLNVGDKCTYLVNNKKPSDVKRSMKDLGWDIESLEKKLSFIDSYSGFMGIQGEEKYMISDPSNLEDLDSMLMELFSKIKNQVFIFDSLSTLIDVHGNPKEIQEKLIKWVLLCKKRDITSVYLFTRWPYGDIKTIENIFDAVINLKTMEERVIFSQYFELSRANWAKPVNKRIPFKVAMGGVHVYMPKILVTGPHNAGKSSLVEALSTKSISVDRLGTTIALDHGKTCYNGFMAELFGTPGQERFDPIIKLLSGEALGVLLIIDSTQPETFTRAKDIISMTKAKGLPYVVVANKQDLPDALNPAQIRDKMKLPDEVKIIPVVATQKKDVFKALDALFEQLI